MLCRESDLSNRGFYLIAQELVYQWLGSWVTPYWWTDAHLNKALAGFLAASTANEVHVLTWRVTFNLYLFDTIHLLLIQINNGEEFDGKWPMTILYSIYYEFSKRYPHSRITAMKQETTCSKTELVLRMLNYTLGADTFRNGLRKLFAKG